MRKTNFLVLLCLFLASQVFAQQSQSFPEYWFGINKTKDVHKSTKKSIPQRASKVGLRSGTAHSSGTITLDLSQPTNPSSFSLGAGRVWSGTYSNEIQYLEFNNSTFMLSHLIDEDGFGNENQWGYWDGFTYSKNGENTNYGNGDSQGWVAHQFGNMAGGGIKTDAEGNVLKENGIVVADPEVPYLVSYWGYFKKMFGSSENETLHIGLNDMYQAVGIYINNHPWPYYGNISGDGFARPFAEGDYFKLFIHGLDENYEDNGKVVEYTLAEFKNGSLQQSPNWEWVDLSALGEIGGIYFTMESTDSDPMFGMNTAAYFCIDKLQVETIQEPEPPSTFAITVPEGASVYVGSKGSLHYVPFTEKSAVYVTTSGGKTTYKYNITGQHNYRVSKAGALTQAGLFTPSASSTSLEITDEQLNSHNPKETDHDVNSNSGYNVADIFLNINEKGHLKLSEGETHQLINLRTWQLTNSTVGNYFIEPDFHYTVVNESGNADNSVVTVDNNGKLNAVGNGTAIVLVTYDAINVHSALAGPFYGALWAENTGVFVVSVGTSASGISPNMTINETLNASSTSKMAGTAVDAELDVFYYLAETGGYDYTFTPSNSVTSVTLAQPEIIETGNTESLKYNGFSGTGITANNDGSYTVRLVHGRNVVKMMSSSGAEYQVLSAKPVTYTISNLTNPGEKFNPGDEASVKFNTLYHPANKMSGVYNMTAGIQYSNGEANFPLILGPGQYTFASKAQEIKMTIPQDFTGEKFTLTSGVIKVNGYGSPYGDHRNITLTSGIAPNLNAQVKTAWFGALPDISLQMTSTATGIEQTQINKNKVYPTVTTGLVHIVLQGKTTELVQVVDIPGKVLQTIHLQSTENTINLSSYKSGMYLIRLGNQTVKIIKQ